MSMTTSAEVAPPVSAGEAVSAVELKKQQIAAVEESKYINDYDKSFMLDQKQHEENLMELARSKPQVNPKSVKGSSHMKMFTPHLLTGATPSSTLTVAVPSGDRLHICPRRRSRSALRKCQPRSSSIIWSRDTLPSTLPPATYGTRSFQEPRNETNSATATQTTVTTTEMMTTTTITTTTMTTTRTAAFVARTQPHHLIEGNIADSNQILKTIIGEDISCEDQNEATAQIHSEFLDTNDTNNQNSNDSDNQQDDSDTCSMSYSSSSLSSAASTLTSSCASRRPRRRHRRGGHRRYSSGYQPSRAGHGHSQSQNGPYQQVVSPGFVKNQLTSHNETDQPTTIVTAKTMGKSNVRSYKDFEYQKQEKQNHNHDDTTATTTMMTSPDDYDDEHDSMSYFEEQEAYLEAQGPKIDQDLTSLMVVVFQHPGHQTNGMMVHRALNESERPPLLPPLPGTKRSTPLSGDKCSHQSLLELSPPPPPPPPAHPLSFDEEAGDAIACHRYDQDCLKSSQIKDTTLVPPSPDVTAATTVTSITATSPPFPSPNPYFSPCDRSSNNFSDDHTYIEEFDCKKSNTMTPTTASDSLKKYQDQDDPTAKEQQRLSSSLILPPPPPPRSLSQQLTTLERSSVAESTTSDILSSVEDEETRSTKESLNHCQQSDMKTPETRISPVQVPETQRETKSSNHVENVGENGEAMHREVGQHGDQREALQQRYDPITLELNQVDEDELSHEDRLQQQQQVMVCIDQHPHVVSPTRSLPGKELQQEHKDHNDGKREDVESSTETETETFNAQKFNIPSTVETIDDDHSSDYSAQKFNISASVETIDDDHSSDCNMSTQPNDTVATTDDDHSSDCNMSTPPNDDVRGGFHASSEEQPVPVLETTASVSQEATAMATPTNKEGLSRPEARAPTENSSSSYIYSVPKRTPSVKARLTEAAQKTVEELKIFWPGAGHASYYFYKQQQEEAMGIEDDDDGGNDPWFSAPRQNAFQGFFHCGHDVAAASSWTENEDRDYMEYDDFKAHEWDTWFDTVPSFFQCARNFHSKDGNHHIFGRDHSRLSQCRRRLNFVQDQHEQEEESSTTRERTSLILNSSSTVLDSMITGSDSTDTKQSNTSDSSSNYSSPWTNAVCFWGEQEI